MGPLKDYIPILAKANDRGGGGGGGVDWVTFLPMVLFAVRQITNRDTGFSPH